MTTVLAQAIPHFPSFAHLQNSPSSYRSWCPVKIISHNALPKPRPLTSRVGSWLGAPEFQSSHYFQIVHRQEVAAWGWCLLSSLPGGSTYCKMQPRPVGIRAKHCGNQGQALRESGPSMREWHRGSRCFSFLGFLLTLHPCPWGPGPAQAHAIAPRLPHIMEPIT